MTVSHQAKVNDYHNSVLFSENAITNIIVLSNLRLQYFVTYRRNDMMLIINTKSEVKPNIQFRMHESGLQYFESKDKQ